MRPSCEDRPATTPLLHPKSLPELPQVDLTEFPSAVREQVQEAYDAARANSRDANASGKLGMLLDLHRNRLTQDSDREASQQALRLTVGGWYFRRGFLGLVRRSRRDRQQRGHLRPPDQGCGEH